MYKFDFYINEYRAKAGHLDQSHHGAYLLLMLTYYHREAPIPGNPDETHRLTQAITQVERDAIANVLKTFFALEADGCWHNSRADEEIEKYHQFLEKQKENGAKGGRPKTQTITQTITQTKPKPNPGHNPNHNPNETLSSSPSSPSSPTPTPPTNGKRTTSMSIGKPTDAGVRLSDLLLTEIRKRIPDSKEPNRTAWAREFDRLLRLDGRTEDDAAEMIRCVQADPFWAPNVMSPKKLREKWDQLAAKRKGGNWADRTGALGLPLSQLGTAGQETAAAAARVYEKIRAKEGL